MAILSNTVGIKELKNRLTHYLRQTRLGEEIIITDRNRPIAVIQRIESVEEPLSVETRLAKMAAEGLLTLPTRKPARRIRKVKSRGVSMSKAIIEGREERF